MFKLSSKITPFLWHDNQAEVDKLRGGFVADGGVPSPCAWLKDRFGLWWQIVKFDIAALQLAFDGH